MMNKAAKIWLTAAAILILLGAIIFTVAMSASGWDLNKLGTVTYTTDTYEPGNDFKNISIDVDTTEIEFAPSDDGTCKIVCFEDEKIRHSVSVQNGTLIIKTVDTRKWYEHISVSFDRPKLTVYLPQTEYRSLAVKTDTGDMTIPEDFSFDTLSIEGDTCDVNCFASARERVEIDLSTGAITLEEVTAGQMKLKTDTGRIRVRRAAVSESIRIETDTGRVTLEELTCKNLDAKSDTGSITLENVVGSGRFEIETDTGDVALDNSDAAELSIKTDTGDVTGQLLSDKIFLTETDTGRVNVPKSTTGGKCEIKTSTGDIRVGVR